MEDSFNKVIDLLYLAKQDGVEVVLNEERLQIKIAEDKIIDENLLREIRNNKQLIINYLSNDNWKSTTVVKNQYEIGRFNRELISNIPLSFSQERLWFVDQLEGSIQYHSPSVLRLTGDLDIGALSHSIKKVIERHEILRTIFREEDGQVFQSVKEDGHWQLEIIEGSQYLVDGSSLKGYIESLVKEPFDLSSDYPVRGSLICLSADVHVLVVTMHHIASDAWSVSIIVKEVVELYNSYVEGRAADLAELPVQYADYAVWQRNYLQGEILKKKIGYWKQKLSGSLPLQLPTDYSRPAVRGTKGASFTFSIDKGLLLQLHDLSRQQGTSLFMLLLSAFKVLLYRYSGQQDISVGTSIASRQQKELEGLVGFFVNTLTLRDELKGDACFIELLQQVKTTTLEAYEHQELPFEKVVEVVVSERDPSRSPLFQVMLVLGNTPESSKLKLGEVALSGEPVSTNVSKFDLTFFIGETVNGLQCTVEYSTDLFNEATIQHMTTHFSTLLGSVVKSPHQKIGLLPMLTDAETQQLQGSFNNSEVVYPVNKSIVELFEDKAAQGPENTAIVFAEERLSYRELNERSNQLAHYLKSLGVKQDTPVPLYVERSAIMVVGILGILKSGAAYVPIDTDFPAERISYMLEDAGSAFLVSSKESSEKLPASSATKVIIADGEELDKWPITNVSEKPLPGDLAYIIYTSGSTGKPKGVMIEHGCLVDYYYGLAKQTQIDECASFALVSTIATDLGNTVIYGSLLSGGALHVFTKESVSNIEYLHRYFSEHQIDCIKIVPSHWKALSPEDNLLLPQKLLVFGGEALPSELVEDIRLSGSPCRIVNHYGPTETTIGKLLHEVKPGYGYGKTIPIGKPFSNTGVYILSKEMQLCPVGIPGQLYITGDGLSRGYFNKGELTTEKFIADSFARETGKKMYGTGDLVKWLPDGNIEFIGRLDDQVKIRGYPIELGEIASVLQQSPMVKQAEVLAKEDKQGNKRLVGYVIGTENFDRDNTLHYLKEQLPDYMIPSALVELETMPLTENGKVDRKALPDPFAEDMLSGKYTAPRNETETKLSEIWEEILELEQVGINDDFFELGGHSLLAVRLVSAIRKSFTVEMPIGDIFDYPTVALLAAQLSNQSNTVVLPVIEKTVPRPERIPLSFSQERLWFIHQLAGSLQYHLPSILRLKGKLDIDALSNALQQIINRHEILRTVILDDAGIGYQQIKDYASWQLELVDGASYKDDTPELQQYIKQCISLPFNLMKDFMLRATLISLETENHILVVTLHHIASDGWSTSIIVKELEEFYNAAVEMRTPELVELPIQYADFAMWQRRYLQGEILDSKLGYWKDKLDGVATLNLFTDFPRPYVQSTNGAATSFRLEKELLQQLQTLSQQQGATLFMTMLAVLKVLLYRYTGQQDICVGTPVAGRQQKETEGLVGFFINTLALRSELVGDTSFKDFLRQERNNTLEAYAHQEVPFEKVVEAVVKERNMSRSPLFQVMLVFQNTPEIAEVRLSDVQLSRGFGKALANNTTKFELTFNITEIPQNQGLDITVEYCTDLFKNETIHRMMTHFKRLLTSVVETPEQSIGFLQMLTNQDEQQLLFEFNDAIVDYPKEKTIVDLFEEQALKTPENIALVFRKEQLSYGELNERANQLANYLHARGVKKDSLVPICMERGIEMLVAILGILKAGGAYVPVDPDYPADRVSFMLEDTGAQILVTSKKGRLKLPATNNIEEVEIDGNWLAISKETTDKLKIKIKPGNLAYVIYTSGSTGKPKGVLIEHHNVVRLFKTSKQQYDFTDKDVWTLFHSISFDFSVWEIFGALLYGGRLVIVQEQETKDISLFAKLLANEQVTILNQTPSAFYGLQDFLVHAINMIRVRYVIFGGEALNPASLQPWKKLYPDCRLINMYGITETTVHVTYQEIGWQHILGGKSVIGKPIPTLKVYILDTYQHLVPVGVAGELYIGGDGLARGYLNRAALTTERFINDPFNKESEARLYRTGDLGVWLPDGNIEYLGRIDEQVKINGYRIELGEIETVLQQTGLVRQSVVVAKEDKFGFKRLVGYVVPEGIFNRELTIDLLKSKLPDYMVPTIWMELKSFPLTANGKINKKILPDPNPSELLINQYIAPRNELEAKLAGIWQDLLGVQAVGIRDNFFELGGHSLYAIRLVAIIRRKMEVEIPINYVFIYPTIGDLVKNFIEKIKNPSLPAVNIKYFVPVKKGGNKLPLYIVAGGGGTALRFKKFSALLDTEQPVYVLQPPVETKELKEFPATIEGIAAKFLEEIFIQNPDGPYALSGHCVGGIIAFEMARQLEAAGKKVHLLALFDSIIRNTIKPEPGTFRNLYQLPLAMRRYISRLALKVNFETFLITKHTRQSVRYKTNTIKAFIQRKIGSKSNAHKLEKGGVEIFDESAEIYVTANKNYTLLPYKGDVVAFYANEHYYFLDRDKNVGYKKLHLDESTKNSWRQYATNVFIHEVEGEHSGIFDPVHGDKFALVLQQYLNNPPV